jgi:hypothetical protein
MAVSLVQSAKYVGSVSQTTVNFTLPTAPAIGNLLIATVMYNTSVGTAVTPAGWTLKQSDAYGAPGIVTIYHVVQSGDTGLTWNIPILPANGYSTGYLYEITNYDATTPFNQYVNYAVPSATTSITGPSTTPTVIGTLPLSFVVSIATGASDTATPSGGFTENLFSNSSAQQSWMYQHALTTDTTTTMNNSVTAMYSGQAMQTLMLIAPGVAGGTTTSTTNIVNETMAVQPSAGQYINNGVSGGGWNASGYFMTNNNVNQWGNYQFTSVLPSEFTSSADFAMSTTSGADGAWFYYGASVEPHTEGDSIGGYLINRNDFGNIIEIRFNGSTLTSVSYTKDTTYDTLSVAVSGQTFTITYKGTVVLSYTDATTRTLAGSKFGWGSRSGGSANGHTWKNYLLTIPAVCSTGDIKVYNGTAFVAKPVKIWTGTAWVKKPVKRWNGTTWVVTTY